MYLLVMIYMSSRKPTIAELNVTWIRLPGVLISLRLLGDINLALLILIMHCSISVFRSVSTYTLKTSELSVEILSGRTHSAACSSTLVQPFLAQEPHAAGNVPSRSFLHLIRLKRATKRRKLIVPIATMKQT